MQGFPIGGSRIRLSWGRSQCGCLLGYWFLSEADFYPDKAAQAVVQQAQQSAIQAAEHRRHEATPPRTHAPPSQTITAQLTEEQVLQLLQHNGHNGYNGYQSPVDTNGSYHPNVDPSYNPPGFAPAPYRDMQPQMDQYVRPSFAPFEHHHSRSDGARQAYSSQQQQYTNLAFNRAPGFGPSPSLPANLKISPLKLSTNGRENGVPSPPSTGTQSVFNTSEPSPYHQFFDGAAPNNQATYLHIAGALRKDSQPILRASSAVSIKRSVEEVPAPSPFGDAGVESDIHDLNGSLKNLAIGSRSRSISRAMVGKEAEEKRNGGAASPPSSLGSY